MPARRDLVSMRFAPSFRQPPAEEVIGKPLRDIPADCVTAYVLPEVISPAEESALMQWVEPWFDRLPYHEAHLDDLIHHYKEFYRSYKSIPMLLHRSSGDDVNRNIHNDNNSNTRKGNYDDMNEVAAAKESDERRRALVCAALQRARQWAEHYSPHIPIDDRVHFLRLAGSGFIRAHVDETRNSSGIVAGLCLSAGRVMTLTHPDHPGEKVELLLAPRCFYLLIGTARYTWRHSVDWTGDDEEHVRRIHARVVGEGTPVVFDGQSTEYRRYDRTAIIFRGISPMHLFAQRRGTGGGRATTP